jgi:hypothetical protein
MNPFNTNDWPKMPLLTISSPETIEKCSKLPVGSNDIFICSYPKSGTTWTQHIVISLLLLQRRKKQQRQEERQDEDEEVPYTHVSQYAPFFEIDPHWDGNELISSIQQRHSQIGWRIFNTHLRGNMLPGIGYGASKHKEDDGERGDEKNEATTTSTPCRNNKGKIIYLVRSPLDACVSFYHHLSKQVEGEGTCYEKTLHDFFQEWIEGKLPYGSWADHVRSYAPLIANNDAFLMCYEDMVHDLPGSIRKLVKFLELDEDISQQDLEELLPSFTFSNMKKDLKRFQPISVAWKDNFQFLRKGEVGDHRNSLSDDDRNIFQEYLEQSNFYDDLKASLGGKGAAYLYSA